MYVVGPIPTDSDSVGHGKSKSIWNFTKHTQVDLL